MFIEKIETGFTNTIVIGNYSNFVYTKKNSVYITPEELFEKLQSFNNIVFLGEDPLLQKDELGKICRKLVKNNSNVKIVINTTGLVRPVEINYYRDNVMFNVYLPLTNSKLPYDKRINENSLHFYIEINANFIFDIKTLDDIDEVSTLQTSLGIKKSQVFLSSVSDINLLQQAKLNGYNICPLIEW